MGNRLLKILKRKRQITLYFSPTSSYIYGELAINMGGYFTEFQLCMKCSLQSVKQLISSNRDLVKHSDGWGTTALHLAARVGNLDVVEFLIASKAKINARNFIDQTPLHVAASGNHAQVCQCLISHGANVNDADSKGRTPVYLASDNISDTTDLLKILFEGGASICSVPEFSGQCPFRAATFRNNVPVMMTLFKKGSNPESRDVEGNTPLHLSAQNGCYKAARFLLFLSVKLDSKNNHNETPFYLAMEKRHLGVANLLASAGLDIKNESIIYDREEHWLFGQESEDAITRYFASFNTKPRTLQELSIFIVRKRLGRRLPFVVDLLPCPAEIGYHGAGAGVMAEIGYYGAGAGVMAEIGYYGAGAGVMAEIGYYGAGAGVMAEIGYYGAGAGVMAEIGYYGAGAGVMAEIGYHGAGNPKVNFQAPKRS